MGPRCPNSSLPTTKYLFVMTHPTAPDPVSYSLKILQKKFFSPIKYYRENSRCGSSTAKYNGMAVATAKSSRKAQNAPMACIYFLKFEDQYGLWLFSSLLQYHSLQSNMKLYNFFATFFLLSLAIFFVQGAVLVQRSEGKNDSPSEAVLSRGKRAWNAWTHSSAVTGLKRA
ncbi:unnamed protein product [Allacma fusca]|uniref:Uncharacterized protein n=1 Tax=Allacma fusca TaxID=39272 RepID=A0A8J2LD16_9HEXA|nr:unnamed protein product [Allacma fusca]